MRRFKEGEIIKIKNDLEVGKKYGEDYFLEGMEKYRGKKLTVLKDVEIGYFVEETFVKWLFTNEMIEE